MLQLYYTTVYGTDDSDSDTYTDGWRTLIESRLCFVLLRRLLGHGQNLWADMDSQASALQTFFVLLLLSFFINGNSTS
jgi:hypothetical protein